MGDFDILLCSPGWRNWQTQRTQNPPGFGPWGFNSPSRHQRFQRSYLHSLEKMNAPLVVHVCAKCAQSCWAKRRRSWILALALSSDQVSNLENLRRGSSFPAQGKKAATGTPVTHRTWFGINFALTGVTDRQSVDSGVRVLRCQG